MNNRQTRPTGKTQRAMRMNAALTAVLDRPTVSAIEVAQKTGITRKRATYIKQVVRHALRHPLDLGGHGLDVVTWDELRAAYRRQVDGHLYLRGGMVGGKADLPSPVSNSAQEASASAEAPCNAALQPCSKTSHQRAVETHHEGLTLPTPTFAQPIPSKNRRGRERRSERLSVASPRTTAQGRRIQVVVTRGRSRSA